jgi:uncharacterized protein (TIGR00730 family)
MLQRICVFCGSSPGVRPVYADAARALGEAIARRGLGLVYGGATVGLMGTVAEAAMAAGGEVIGVIPQPIEAREIANRGVTKLHVVGSMHERKALMSELSDGFVALPGGYGTLDELFEILTWAQLGLHAKPIALLDVADYFAPLLTYLDHARTEGFLRPAHRDTLLRATDPTTLLDLLATSRPPAATKWIALDQT